MMTRFYEIQYLYQLIYLLGIMGACCDNLFGKEEIHTNQSRLKLLQSKVNAIYQTENDSHFTYYLRIFQLHYCLQKMLKDYKTHQQSEETNENTINNQQIVIQHGLLREYIQALDNPASLLRSKIAQDESKIIKNFSPRHHEACLIKLQMQNIELIKGISHVKIMQFVIGRQQNPKQEYLIVNRMKKEKVYRQFLFPSMSGKIKLVSEPINASLTIDVQDIARSEIVCNVFNFKFQGDEFGFVALRMQLVSLNQSFQKERNERLAMLDKELRMCQLGKQGLDKLSEYKSDTSSLRNTFLSEPVSEYPNHYQI